MFFVIADDATVRRKSAGLPSPSTSARGKGEGEDLPKHQGSVKVVRCVILNRSEGSSLSLKEDSSLRLRVTKPTAIGFFSDFDGALPKHYIV